MEINRLAAFSGDLSGVRRHTQTKFLNGMGVDGLQDNKAYAAHGAHLHPVLEEVSEAQLRKNRALVRAHMIEVHGAEPDEYGRVGIMVSADGSWPIRGYNSCSGQGALIYEDGDAFRPTIIAQHCRGRYCGKCMWYEKNEPTYVVPPNVCPRNYDGSSKSMEADILCHLVEEVAMYERPAKAGDFVEVPMEERLQVEDVCCDEYSTFSVRLTDSGILKYASAPRKLSDLNHLSGCLFKRLKKLKAEKFRGTHMYVKKGKKGKCTGEREPEVTVNVKDEVIAAMERFLELDLLGEINQLQRGVAPAPDLDAGRQTPIPGPSGALHDHHEGCCRAHVARRDLHREGVLRRRAAAERSYERPPVAGGRRRGGAEAVQQEDGDEETPREAEDGEEASRLGGSRFQGLLEGRGS
jgi:hypothetical protein